MKLRPVEAGRLVYAGRFAEDVGGMGDDDRLHAAELRTRLDASRALGIVDAVGFPYERLSPRHFDLPVDVVLADDRFDHDELVAVLHTPLLSHLTPMDRIVVADDSTWQLVQSRYRLDDDQRIRPADDSIPSAVEALAATWRSESVLVVEAAFGTFAGHADDLVTRHLQEYGAHQRSDLAALRSLTRPGDLVVDVGAHIGTFAIPLARAVGAAGSLVAFEPDPANAALLRENVARENLETVTVVERAVGSDARYVMASIVEGNTGALAMTRARATDTDSVSGVSLDDWWRSEGRPTVHVLKIDAEGMEGDVLAGASELIGACQPVLQVEVAQDQLISAGSDVRTVEEFLDGHDYELFRNSLERNRPDDEFRLEPLANLLGPSERVFDVWCIVRGSDRTPATAASA